MAGPDLGLEQFRAGQEGPGLAEPADHLYSLPDAHLGHLPHDDADLVKLVDKLLDLVRPDAAARSNAAATAHVDDVRIAALVLRHRVDHALNPLQGHLGILALRDHVAHA